ncbi:MULTISPECIES: hypothetical protein [unclassified Mesorhizobium]|uniref:hypothetical protein n=1 Tax=unclassified Mesorhizobium TaxID=325217 RepID=UPI00333A6CE9
MPFICAGGVLFVVRLSQDRSFEKGFSTPKKCPGAKMVPGWSNSRTSVNDFPSGIAQKQRAPSGFLAGNSPALAVGFAGARVAAARLHECRKSKNLTRRAKKSYKNFVDVCLTDFCYPRAKARL